MTTTFQISTKPTPADQAILVVKIEAPDDAPIDRVYSRFVEAASAAGVQDTLDRFDPTTAAAIQAAQPLVNPVAALPQQAVQSWGNPPVPPMQQPQVPAAAAPTCQHGTKKLIEKPANPATGKKAWRAWGCPARSDDPTSCGLDFIR